MLAIAERRRPRPADCFRSEHLAPFLVRSAPARSASRMRRLGRQASYRKARSFTPLRASLPSVQDLRAVMAFALGPEFNS